MMSGSVRLMSIVIPADKPVSFVDIFNAFTPFVWLLFLVSFISLVLGFTAVAQVVIEVD